MSRKHSNRLPQHTPNQSREITITSRKEEFSYSSALPPPQMLEMLEQICPGSADRVLTRYEKQSDHRQDLESRMINSNIRNELLGQIFGFIIFLVALIGGFVLIYLGLQWQGFVALVAALGVPTALFIVGRDAGKRAALGKKSRT